MHDTIYFPNIYIWSNILVVVVWSPVTDGYGAQHALLYPTRPVKSRKYRFQQLTMNVTLILLERDRDVAVLVDDHLHRSFGWTCERYHVLNVCIAL